MRLALIAAGFAVVVGVPYKYYEPPQKTQACVRVEWTETERDSNLLCGPNAGGCLLQNALGPLIVAPMPRSFNDQRRLEILGHEFLHALGANHD